ncbi:FtsX-like permease family protein [Kitasatospora sp. NPDC093679]|uniref:ABC transporter permease n=1 Tax=Kitasatospora sp. NPDC093679 TaxID=3154983 RepID=UPI0034358C9F
MYRTALRNVLAHKGRLLMTALAVLLGTAFVAGTMVFSDTLGEAMKNSLSKSYSDISVLVTDPVADSPFRAKDRSGPNRGKLTDDTVAKIAALPGTERARGNVSGFVGVADRKGDLIGQGWSSRGSNYAPDASGKDTRYPMAEGRGPQAEREIALDRRTAEKGGYHVGDTVRIASDGPATERTLVGVFTTDDPEVESGGTLTLFDRATAQKLLLAPGQYSTVAVTAKPGTSQDELLRSITAVLPGEGQMQAETGQELTDRQTRMIADGTTGMKTALLAFAGISLFVGIFIIANTFTMLVAQRTRELALLRAVGAGRGQVTRSVLIEALLIGVIASAAGLATGIGIGAGMRALLDALDAGLPAGPLVVAPATVAVSLVVGVVVTTLSALLPAVRASRIAPVAAMSSGDQPAPQKSLIVRNVIGGLIAAGGLGLVALGAASGDSSGRVPVAAGAGLALIGIFILLPLLSRPVIALVGPLLRASAGTAGRLAQQNAVRNPRRTAATAAALTIGLALVSSLTVLGASVGDAVDRSVTSSMTADYSIKTANGISPDPKLAAAVAEVPGVAAVSPMSDVYWKLGGSERAISGVDAGAVDKVVALTLDSGSAASLKEGQVLVQAETAKGNGWAVGTVLPVEYPDGSTARVTVGGVFRKNELLSPVVMANTEVFKHSEDPYVTQILVKAADGPSDGLRKAIKDATGSNPVIDVKTKQDIRDEFSKIITFMLNLMYGLLAMSVLVAVLGVVNTLAMSVFERKREIGMLRAIGLDRRGVKRMVRLESVVISMFGAVIGVLLGCFLAWAVNGTLESSLPGLATVLPYGKLLLFLALAGLVGMVAAIWPARRAARLDILGAIKTD